MNQLPLHELTARNEALEAENAELRRKLAVSQRWMEREVRDSAHKIATKRVGKMSITDRDEFL